MRKRRNVFLLIGVGLLLFVGLAALVYWNAQQRTESLGGVKSGKTPMDPKSQPKGNTCSTWVERVCGTTVPLRTLPVGRMRSSISS